MKYDDGRTHYMGCWRKHKDCADMLVERIASVTRLAEREIFQHGIDEFAKESIGELQALRWYVGGDGE